MRTKEEISQKARNLSIVLGHLRKQNSNEVSTIERVAICAKLELLSWVLSEESIENDSKHTPLSAEEFEELESKFVDK